MGVALPPSPQIALPPSPQIAPVSPSPTPFEASSGMTRLPAAFEHTTLNLLKLGSLTMDKFAENSSKELDGFDIAPGDPAYPGYYIGDNSSTTRNDRNDEYLPEEIPNVAPSEAVRYLREAVSREFGPTINDPLKYEFLEEFGEDRGSCILTITRPNGLSRSYRTKAEFSRKSDAKIAAASSAIQLGAVHFVKYGDAKSSTKRGLVLAKLDVAAVKKDETGTNDESEGTKHEVAHLEEEDNSAVAQIETCCIEWRADSVIPKWVHLIDPKTPHAHGYALKISLSNNIERAYSILPSEDYPKRSIAKIVCARTALEQNVLEFIKHGDGLKEPIVVPFAGAEAIPPPPPPTVTSLQAFHDTLPKPLPDQIGVKPNGETNAVGWLNTIVQMAKGSRMTAAFTWYTDAKLGLHGCLLRLSRPDNAPSQSYFVDAIFSKRADAKIAVCLLACSQGVGAYIRSVAADVDARVTPEMRRRATEQILPMLGQTLNKFKHGSRPEFEYECDLATFGCTLTIELTTDEKSPIKKQWKVPLAYKSKADAKFAVVCAAADEGVIEIIKACGKELEGELEEGETIEGGTGKKKKKKKGKEGEDAEEVDNEEELLKKVRGSRNLKGEPVFETREEAIAKGRFTQKKQTLHRGFGSGRGRGSRFTGNLNARGRGMGMSGPRFMPRVSSVGLGAPAPALASASAHIRPPSFTPYARPHPHRSYLPHSPHGYDPPPSSSSNPPTYGSYTDPREHEYHPHLYHALSDPAFAYTHSPPRVPPRYGSPGYRRDYECHEYRAGSPQGYPGSAYSYEYTHPSRPPPSAYGAEYNYDEYRPQRTDPRVYEEHYAADYDYIPERVPPSHRHIAPVQFHSSSRGSGVPRYPRSHAAPRASYSRPPPPPMLTTREGGSVYDREEFHPVQSHSSVGEDTKVKLEKTDSAISNLEGAGVHRARSSRSEERAARDESSTQGDDAEQVAILVPSKRGRSTDQDPQDNQTNKRVRERSDSAPRPSERSTSADSIQEDAVDVEGESGLKQTEEIEAKEKQRWSQGKDKEGGKSYIAALFDHCDKEGIARPDMCHEEITDKDGEKAFRVWIVMGKERMELPTSFTTLNAGKERVAKSVLGRLRVQTKRRQEV